MDPTERAVERPTDLLGLDALRDLLGVLLLQGPAIGLLSRCDKAL